MHTLVVLLALTAISVLGLRYRALPLGTALALWVLIPSVAAKQVTHLSQDFHPATILILLYAAARTVIRPVKVRLPTVAKAAIALLVAVMAVAVLTTFLQTARHPILSSETANIYVAPVLFLVLVAEYCCDMPDGLRQGQIAVLLLGGFEAAYALVQSVEFKHGVSSALLFASSYSKQYWFPALNRPLGTTDQPLFLGLLLVTCIPLVIVIRNRVGQIALAGLYFAGIIVAHDRAATLFGSLGLTYVVLRVDTPYGVRPARVVALTIGLTGMILSGIAEPVLARIHTVNLSDPSTFDRLQAYRYFAGHWSAYLFTGQGVGSSSSLGQSGILHSGLENPILITSVDLGIATAVALTVAQVTIAAAAGTRPAERGLVAAVALLLGQAMTFNSTSNPSLASPLLYLLLGMTIASRTAPTNARGSNLRRESAGAGIAQVRAEVGPLSVGNPSESRPLHQERPHNGGAY